MSVSLRVGSRSSFSASRGRATSFGRTREGRSLVDTSESDVRVIWLTSSAYSTAGRQLSLSACRLGVGRRVRGAISWPAACRAARGSHLSQGYVPGRPGGVYGSLAAVQRSEEHTSELQSRQYLVCRLLLEKKKKSFSDSESYHHLRI